MFVLALDEIVCPTPRCIELRKEYGPRHHVHAPYLYHSTLMPDAIAFCSDCGGFFDGETWLHECTECHVVRQAGELVGFSTPHLCQKCKDAIIMEERNRGAVCSRCHRVHSACFC